MKFTFSESHVDHSLKAISEWSTVRTTFAWLPVYLKDTGRYAWLERVNYHRVSDYHWRFHRQYFETQPEVIK